jgi:hypothetical protein
MTRMLTYALAVVGLGALLTLPQVQKGLWTAVEMAEKLRASVVAAPMAAPGQLVEKKEEPGGPKPQGEGGVKQDSSPMIRVGESESDLPGPVQEGSDANGAQKALDFYLQEATKKGSRAG